MKASDFRKFYLTFVVLYGVIDSNESYKIIKKFFPDLKKSDYLKDLKDRNNKFTREYMVRKTYKRNEYIIQNEFFDDDLIDHIFSNMRGKDYYVLDDLNQYWNIGKFGIDIKDVGETFENELLKKGLSKNDACLITMLLYEKIRKSLDYNEPIQALMDVVKPKDIDDAQELLNAYMIFSNNVRMYTNGGYTPKELADRRGPIDLNEMEINIGPNMKESFMEDLDPEEMIEMLKNDDRIPLKAKNSMIKQLEEIVELKKRKVKA